MNNFVLCRQPSEIHWRDARERLDSLDPGNRARAWANTSKPCTNRRKYTKEEIIEHEHLIQKAANRQKASMRALEEKYRAQNNSTGVSPTRSLNINPLRTHSAATLYHPHVQVDTHGDASSSRSPTGGASSSLSLRQVDSQVQVESEGHSKLLSVVSDAVTEPNEPNTECNLGTLNEEKSREQDQIARLEAREARLEKKMDDLTHMFTEHIKSIS